MKKILILLAIILASCSTSVNVNTVPITGFLGLKTNITGAGESEGRTDYDYFLKSNKPLNAIMIFALFNDKEKDEDTKELYSRLVPEAQEYFKKVSYGKFQLNVDVVHRWFPIDMKSKSGLREGHFKALLDKVDSEVNFNNYDIVYVVGSYAAGLHVSPTVIYSKKEKAHIYDGKKLRHFVTFGRDSRGKNWGWQTLVHETGHILGLPDLYNYDKGRKRRDVLRFIGSWDMMGIQNAGSHFLAWHKYKLGWLSDDNVLLVNVDNLKKSMYEISSIYDDKGYKMVVIPLNENEAYVLEMRKLEGKENARLGILIYKVSTKIGSTKGPIKVVAARLDDDNEELSKKYTTLYNALHFETDKFIDDENELCVKIIKKNGNSYTIEVSNLSKP